MPRFLPRTLSGVRPRLQGARQQPGTPSGEKKGLSRMMRPCLTLDSTGNFFVTRVTKSHFFKLSRVICPAVLLASEKRKKKKKPVLFLTT